MEQQEGIPAAAAAEAGVGNEGIVQSLLERLQEVKPGTVSAAEFSLLIKPENRGVCSKYAEEEARRGESQRVGNGDLMRLNFLLRPPLRGGSNAWAVGGDKKGEEVKVLQGFFLGGDRGTKTRRVSFVLGGILKELKEQRPPLFSLLEHGGVSVGPEGFSATASVAAIDAVVKEEDRLWTTDN
jgi:hypothetical protein